MSTGFCTLLYLWQVWINIPDIKISDIRKHYTERLRLISHFSLKKCSIPEYFKSRTCYFYIFVNLSPIECHIFYQCVSYFNLFLKYGFGIGVYISGLLISRKKFSRFQTIQWTMHPSKCFSPSNSMGIVRTIKTEKKNNKKLNIFFCKRYLP